LGGFVLYTTEKRVGYVIFEKRNINDLRHADYNPRKQLREGDPEYEKIRRSIGHFGYVDPIIINKDNTIIGGHQRATVLKDMGFTEIDCVVVDLNKEDEKALNVALNKISGEWDMELLKELVLDLGDANFDVSLTGFDLADFMDDEDPDEEKYTKEVKTPQYEITGEQPDLSELVNDQKYWELLAEINQAQNVSEAEKEFLRKAASRHLVFNFKNIAEFYAHANADLQLLMEKSALVIIDYNNAIEWGYISLRDDLMQMMEEDEVDEG
jgi:hypothetical protein